MRSNMTEDIWYTQNPLSYFEDYVVHVKKPIECLFVMINFKEDEVDHYLVWFDQHDWKMHDEILFLFSIHGNTFHMKHAYVCETFGDLTPQDYVISLVKDSIGMHGDIVLNMNECATWKDHESIIVWMEKKFL